MKEFGSGGSLDQLLLSSLTGCRVQDAPRRPSSAPDGGSSPETPVDREQRVPVPEPAQQTGRPPGEGADREPQERDAGVGGSGKSP